MDLDAIFREQDLKRAKEQLTEILETVKQRRTMGLGVLDTTMNEIRTIWREFQRLDKTLEGYAVFEKLGMLDLFVKMVESEKKERKNAISDQ